LPAKKNNIPHFQNQRCINSYSCLCKATYVQLCWLKSIQRRHVQVPCCPMIPWSSQPGRQPLFLAGGILYYFITFKGGHYEDRKCCSCCRYVIPLKDSSINTRPNASVNVNTGNLFACALK